MSSRARSRGEKLIHEAQQDASEQAKRFHEIADYIDEVFFVVDSQYTETLYINPAYEKMWGRTCQSLYDDPQSFLSGVHPDDRQRLQAYISGIQQGEQRGKVDFRVIRPDGTVRWVLSQSVPIRNEQGEIYRISGVVNDVTESRETQLALEESLERYRKLTDASFDAIIITQNGRIVEVNRGFVDIFGYDAEELMGHLVSDLVATESRAEVGRRVAGMIDGTYQLVGARKDGKNLLLEATARGHTIRGKPARITALRDITERRALEEQFRQAQKMEAVGRLAGGIAHDFNNLLTVITGYADILLGDVGREDPRRLDLVEIRKAAEAATTLTRQLLAFSRQQVIEPRVVSLEDIVIQTHKLLTHLIGEDIELATKFWPSPCIVLIDPGQMEQVIMNLVVNSRDAMPTGGKITIETAVVDLDEAYAATHWPTTTGRYAMLAVSDTGVGMDEETRAKIFEPFFTTKEPGKGTGLGLAMVYGIVKQSGGFIWAYSEPGKGSTFKIYLPLSDDSPTASREEPAGLVKGGDETILLVEDSDAVRFIALRTLERYGYDVIDASSPSAALEAVSRLERPVHLLLTDVVMPEMSGRVLAETFAGFQPSAKILYMSGYTDDAVIRHGVLDAKTPFLQKPFTPAALAMRVREVLDS